jgi:spore germination protein YaaH
VLNLALLLIGLPPHQEALLEHRDASPVTFRRGLDAAGEGQRVKRTVYGYYPYWVDEFDRVRWDLLTHIAYFSVEISPEGELTSMHGWPSAAFVQTAHDHGAIVDLCFTLFSGTGIRTLTCDPTNSATAITNMIDAMEAGGADGVNLDFEGLLSGTRDCFTNFVRSLREELTARGHPAATISMAAPAVDWTDSFDLPELAKDTDVFFIMGYGYHWGGSSQAGPVGQFRVTPEWRPHISISMQRTLAFYTAQIPADARSVIVWGAPHYGYDWATSSDQLHANTIGDDHSVTYAAARRAIAQGNLRRWDEGSQNPWYAYQDAGGFRQAWYEDEESLAAKYQLALEQGIGGVGMWALGYDGEYPELWDTIDAYFTEEPAALEGDRTLPIRVENFPFTESRDTRIAPSNWFNSYACAPEIQEYGREWVYQIDLCQPGTLAAAVVDGADVDIDLHLLGADSDCLARDDTELSAELAPGTYLLVADSYVRDWIPQEGEYSISIGFMPTDRQNRCSAPLDPIDRENEVAIPNAVAPMTDEMKPPPPPAPEDTGGCACTAHERATLSWPSAVLLLLLTVIPSIRRITWHESRESAESSSRPRAIQKH